MADFPHITLFEARVSEAFTAPSAGGEHHTPPRPDRTTHGKKLLDDLDRAVKQAKLRMRSETVREGIQFIPMRFLEGSEFDLKLQSLAGNESKGIRIISAREKGGRKEYIVAVADSRVETLANKFRQYLTEDTDSGRPKHEEFASSVASIDSAELADYWTDADGTLPKNDEVLWWEIWLDSFAGDDTENWFRQISQRLGITLSTQRVRFPDRLVILAHATLEQWQKFPGLLTRLAEFRRANIVAGEFTALTPSDQSEFINDLLQRTRFAAENAVRVCLLDTGVDRGHPLLERSLSPSDAQSWQDVWGAHDHHGHGTEMAGVCLFGPLGEPLYDDKPVDLSHRLESVKILPPVGRNEPPDYSPITVGAMAMAELAAPDSIRCFCLAVTAEGDDHWRPTLWSAGIDQACAGVADGRRRLVVVSTGNLREDVGKNYPAENQLSSVEDPGQAWNALTVGAYTNLVWIGENGLDGYAPIAPPGSLSPASRTSLCWLDSWPYKPDVVFEGGNYAKNEHGFIVNADDLDLLTTVSTTSSNALLGTTRDTSVATAQAARMAAILQAEYPEYWPETIRGLIVHSAEWTPRMLEEFPRRHREKRLRVYGMGVPNLNRARRSAKGFTTIVIQDQLQPFHHTGGDNASHEMHLHDLPLPREVLEELGSLQVRMRVTLSYFIEPNPPRRGYVARYQYASHGLRFSVRRPQETRERMIKRLSTANWPMGEDGRRIRPFPAIADDRVWDLGPERVSVRGSIHSDAWNGTAAQLALSNLIAVYPVSGWWRYRSAPEIVQKQARYSLVVSISTNDSAIDLYELISHEVKNRISAKAAAETAIGSTRA